MSQVQWIRIDTDLFKNRKISHLRRMPDGDSIVLLWIMLLTLAGEINEGGYIYITQSIPYTSKSLAEYFGMEENTVKLGISAFSELGMIDIQDGFICVSGWEDHQNIEGMNKIRESKRMAQARWRAKQKLIPSTVESTEISTQSLVDDADKNRKEKNRKEKKEEIEVMLSAFPEVDDALKSFIEFRRKAKKPMTDKAVTLLISKLEKMTSNPEEQVEILNQSMINGWTGIYSLKTDSSPKGNLDVLAEWRNAYD